jgi:methanogenic corrinoid protein MtbC1
MKILSAATEIRQNSQDLARKIVEHQYHIQPGEWDRYGESGITYSLRDMNWTLSFLCQALEMDDPALFLGYVSWLKGLFTGLGFGPEALPQMLESLKIVLGRELNDGKAAVDMIELASVSLPEMPDRPASFLETGRSLTFLAEKYMRHLLQGERNLAAQAIAKAIDQGYNIKDIYLEVFQNTQLEIGRLWQMNQITVAQEHYCTSATQMIMAQHYPKVFAGPKNGLKMMGCSVGGELHEMGIRMVSDFFEMEGWDTYYLGASTPAEGLLKAVSVQRPDILCLSTTISFNLPALTDLVAKLRANDGAQNAKILVGGYPFNVSPQLWRKTGADGYARDAGQAVALGNELVGKR